MIILNYWHHEGFDPTTDEPILTIVGIANDDVDIYGDVELLKEAVENHEEFQPLPEILYQLHLERAAISSDPVPERAFYVTKIVEMEDPSGWGTWTVPLIRL